MDEPGQAYAHILSTNYQEAINIVLDQTNPLIVLVSIVLKLLEENQIKYLKELNYLVSSDSPLSLPIDMSLAALAAKRNALDFCDLSLQTQARKLLTFWKKKGENYTYINNNYNTIIQQALYFNPELKLTLDREENQINLDNDVSYNHDGSIVVASVNGIYFDEFGYDFVKSCEKASSLGGLHLHIVKPTQKTINLLDTLREKISWPISWTSDENPEFSGLSYIITSRFMVAEKIMRETNRNIIISDIDATFDNSTSLNVESMLPEEGNAGLFERTNLEPQRICSCSLSYWRYTDETLAFLRLLNNYYWNRLHVTDHYWCLDQLGLYVISRRVERGDFVSAGLEPGNFNWVRMGGTNMRLKYQTEIDKDISDKYKLREDYQEDFDKIKHKPDDVALVNGKITIR